MRMLMALVLLPLLPAAGPAEGIKVTTDRTVDTGSLDAIVRDVVRLSGAKTNDEKAIAIYTWLHHAIFHNAYPVEKAPQSVGPLKAIRVYGWGLCGGQHTILKALFETAGWKVRYRGWEGHTTIEVFYDERWHYFDVFLKCYYWTKDKKTIAGQDDINQDPSIVLDAEKEGRVPTDNYLCCGDEAKGVVDGCKTSKPYPVSEHKDGWASVTGRDQGYSPALTLPSGATLRLEWKGESGQLAVGGQGRHSCGTKDFRSDKDLGPVLQHYGVRNHSNGRLTYAPDFTRAADLAAVTLRGAEAKGGKLTASGGQGVAILALPLPYAYVSAQLEAAFEGDGKLAVSGDGGKTWAPAAPGDVSAIVKQKYDVQIKAEFAGTLAKLRVEAVVEHNRSVQPYLLQGRNQVTVAPGKLAPGAALSVTYAYQEATGPDPAKRQRFEDQGVTYAAAKTLTHEGAAEPWTIEVGGNTAPRMLYLEYSVHGK
ncbi:MAG TPA: hypothetical protein VNM14_02830 [Planctomycetota bacterium]|nr:hypothetical protein [Planctomycetota bacterium]